MSGSFSLTRGTRAVVLFAGALVLAQPALAVPITTLFGPGGPSGPGIQPDASVLNGLEAVTTFGGPNLATGVLGGTPNAGEVLFFAAGPFYIANAGGPSSNGITSGNNRAYGVTGSGRSDIFFDPGTVSSVLLQLRGTNAGSVANAPSTSFPGGTTFADAVGTVLVYTNLGLQLTLSISNTAFETLSLELGATFGSETLDGDSISRISLINQGPSNSAVVLGELTADVVPEPGLALLMGVGIGMLALLRR